jgi:hypothetical protein
VTRGHARVVVGTVLALTAIGIGAPPSAGALAGRSALTVRLDWGSGQKATWKLTCDPTGGTHPNRRRACAFLDGLAHPFSKQPTGMACTMIYSGPETARVFGRWKGKPVDVGFSRNDGCQTAKWQQYRSLFTAPGMVAVRGRVDLGPTCPVERPGETCTTIGAPAVVTATSGTRRRTAVADSQGFLLRLQRGVWDLTADAGMSCPTVRVDTRRPVGPDPLVLSCDTGIRARLSPL